MTTCIVKLSIGVFLLRIVTRKLHRSILFTTMTIILLTSMTFFFFLTFQCKPVRYFWKSFSGMKGECLDLQVAGAMIYAHSGINACADIILTVLPVVIISKLQMNLRTKISVSSIMSLGILYVFHHQLQIEELANGEKCLHRRPSPYPIRQNPSR
jgi:hypothetical protein